MTGHSYSKWNRLAKFVNKINEKQQKKKGNIKSLFYLFVAISNSKWNV